MFDSTVYRGVTDHPARTADARLQIGRLLHDTAMDEVVERAMAAWRASSASGIAVGVMGGHATRRDSDAYGRAAVLGRGLARSGCLVVTGGGPGIMEAVNLGSYLADRPEEALAEALDILARQPVFTDHEPYTRAALDVRELHPVDDSGTDWERSGGMAVATWMTGDIPQPANLFAARTAKYLCNPFPEDRTLSLCGGRAVFAEGRAGTVQEVFMAVSKIYYDPAGQAGPLVLLGKDFWTRTMPVGNLIGKLLSASSNGDLTKRVTFTDEVDEVLEVVLR